MNIQKLWCLALTILVFASCEKEEELTTTIFKEEISGYAQKGPFINGSPIQIFELGPKLSATGKIFIPRSLITEVAFHLQILL